MKKYTLIGIIPVILAVTCKKKDSICEDDDEKYFTVINNSSKTIKHQLYWSYPDSSIGEYDPTLLDGIEPGKSSIWSVHASTCWKEHFEEKGTNEFIHIFDQDTLEAIDWEIIRSTNRGLLNVIEFNLDTLKDNNFTFIITD